MPMRAPRTWRIASASLTPRSSPSSRMRPAVIRPGGGTSRMMDSEVTLFPHPDSPTSPSTSPRSTVKLTRSTARSGPVAVRNSVTRSSTWSSGGTELDLQPRVEGVPQPVPEEVHREHGQHDREAGEGGEPPRGRDVVAAVREHPAPRRGGRLDAEAEEGQGGLVDDHERQLEGGHHDDRGERVRQHVAEQEPPGAIAARPGPGDELPLPDRQHVGPDDPRELHPAGRSHDEDDVEQARPQREDHSHREQDVGNGEEDVDDPHDDRVGAAPEESRAQTERDPQAGGEGHRGEAHQQRDPPPVEDAAQNVPPEVIGPQRMLAQPTRLPRRRAETLEQHLPRRIPRGESGGEQGGGANGEQHRDPEHGPEADPPAARPGDGGPRGADCDRLGHRALRTYTIRGSR